MQRIRTLMRGLQTSAGFGPAVGRDSPHHYRHNSAAANGPSVKTQAVSETATIGIHGRLPFEDWGIRCSENQSPSAQLRFTKTIVHLVANDPAKTEAITEFLVSEGMSVATFTTAGGYLAAARDDRPTCLILDLILPDADG